ncbi:hypothetical protein [Fulvivirga lutimaris]|uniref:hypothetical protein n=1 Tax=Fulvivirga lutimaris TaxID=1819566 RepID=UPI0012BCA274|nr:hypothetical protein [Fulvivirga lutimaris]MTI41970.1 hypothetical protein [Fulvivirga lutimaris]
MNVAIETVNIDSILIQANKYYELDKYKEARLAYESILKVDTTIGEVYYKLGYSIGELQLDTFFIEHPSVKFFVKAAELDYRTDEAYRNAALFILYDDSTKLKYLNKSLELNPEQLEIIKFRDGLKQLMLKDVQSDI